MRFSLLFALLTLTSLLLGCGGSKPKSKPSANPSPAAPAAAAKVSSAAQSDMLQQALVLLEDLDQFNAEVVQREVLQSLNRWLHNRKLDSDWKPDPLIETLPAEVRNVSRMENLATSYFRDPKYPNTFRGSDFDYIEGCVWAYSLSTYVREHAELPPELATWLKGNAKLTSNSQRDDLKTAYVLFDWTVRNIQPRTEASQFAPGTAREPWEALQIGYGDSVERARIFLNLARQQGLNAFALELADADGKKSANVVGVEIAGQVYLFDAAYGLPLTSGEGIATLEEAKAGDGVAKAMSSSKYAYPYSAESFQNATALIDACSASLLQASSLLESQLTGKLRLRLAVEPSKQAETLKSAGLANVRLWEVPIVAEDGLRLRLREQSPSPTGEPPLAQQFYMERQLYDQSSPLAVARLLHLMGRFDNEIQRPGARKMYLFARSFDLQMQKLNFREQVMVLEQQGMRMPRDQEKQRFFVEAMIANAKTLKMIASYQLGQIALDSRQYPSAVDYFEVRTLEEFPQIPFAPQARYGLARANAALSLDKKLSAEEQADARNSAAELLTNIDDLASPQRRGNTLLAERLVPPAMPAEEAEPAEEEKPMEAAEKKTEEKTAEEPAADDEKSE